MSILNVIGLYIAVAVYTLTGVVDPSIWGNWFADVANMFINMI